MDNLNILFLDYNFLKIIWIFELMFANLSKEKKR